MELADGPVTTSAVRIDEALRGAFDLETIVVGAFDALGPRLKGFALRAVRDPDVADDVVQESFLRLVSEVRSGSVPDDLGAWLFTVCGRIIVSRGRRLAVADRMRSLLVDRRQPRSPEEVVIGAEASALTTDALSRLPMDARVALLMAAAGYSSAEIGRAIGRTESAAMTYLCRARGRLRDALATMDGPR
jgi:RNA polymerase sigma-70 factor (ECF subfamily)